jgi:hypothetical protein
LLLVLTEIFEFLLASGQYLSIIPELGWTLQSVLSHSQFSLGEIVERLWEAVERCWEITRCPGLLLVMGKFAICDIGSFVGIAPRCFVILRSAVCDPDDSSMLSYAMSLLATLSLYPKLGQMFGQIVEMIAVVLGRELSAQQMESAVSVMHGLMFGGVDIPPDIWTELFRRISTSIDAIRDLYRQDADKCCELFCGILGFLDDIMSNGEPDVALGLLNRSFAALASLDSMTRELHDLMLVMLKKYQLEPTDGD